MRGAKPKTVYRIARNPETDSRFALFGPEGEIVRAGDRSRELSDWAFANGAKRGEEVEVSHDGAVLLAESQR